MIIGRKLNLSQRMAFYFWFKLCLVLLSVLIRTISIDIK